jgi:hypothetical protein
MPEQKATLAAADLALLARGFALAAGPSTEPRAAEVVRLSNQGEYEEAARLAKTLLGERDNDLQVLVRHLFGVFLDHGFAALPPIFLGLDSTLEGASVGLGDKKAKARAELAITWLCRTLRDRIDFQSVQRDAAYKASLAAIDVKLEGEIRAAAGALSETITRLLGGTRSVEQLAGISAFATDTLRSAAIKPAPRAAPAPAPSLTPEPPSASAREDAAAPVPAPPRPNTDRTSPPSPPPREGPPLDYDSPALRTFLDKLGAFAALMERGDYSRAAIIASDINHIVEHFDPRVYLPRLLSPYFRRLSAGVDELSPHWESAESPAWKAMEQLYQVDLEAFLEEG